MIGHRMIFSFLPLFLTLVVAISTAPILDFQLASTRLGEAWSNETIPTTEVTNYDDNSTDSDEEDIQSTTVITPEKTTSVVNDGHLAADATDIPLDIDEILKLTDHIFSDYQDILPSTPTTESPEDSDDDD